MRPGDPPVTVRPTDPPGRTTGPHARTADEVLARLDTSRDGLSPDEAAARLLRFGRNALVLARPVPAWRILVDQCRSTIVALLAAAAALSWALGDRLDALAILVVLLLDVAIGSVTEWRARRRMDALRDLEVQSATVRRAGVSGTLDARDLVPGDVVLLESGVAVPADLRLLVATDLRVNEASLTGEALPVDKHARPLPPETPLPERACLAYKGTLVVAGTGEGVVVATGAATEIGRISALVAATEDEQAPLERRLAQLGRRLVALTLLVVVLVTALGLLRGGETWLMVQTGIALAVAAVPEGLPVVAVITLAVGMARMARQRALVRRLPAVEALGSVTVVCTDKTGTLTAGEMTVTRLCLAEAEYDVDGSGYAPVGGLRVAGAPVVVPADGPLRRALEVCALTNRARLLPPDGGRGWRVEGDPTDGALLVLAEKAGSPRGRLLAEHPERAEVPFSSERMLHATLHEVEDGMRLLVKGAPHVLLERSTAVATARGPVELDAGGRARWAERNEGLASAGSRVLALAWRDIPAGAAARPVRAEDVTGLQFLGLLALSDPPAAGASAAIARLHAAGIRTLMITGDQRLTAQAVARDLGVLREGETTLDATALDGLLPDALAARLVDVAVLARASPEQKLLVVHGLQRRGEIVGMLGDGVNDAAALKGADVGVAMGRRGTDVAKETADVVLGDDRLATVAVAVEGGRVIDDNIRKFVFYLFSSNLSEVLVLLGGNLAGLPLPLLPLQILWLNLVTDVFPALALALEPAEPDVMQRPPRDPGTALLSRRFVIDVVLHAALLTAVTLALFAFGLSPFGLDEAQARTLGFAGLATAQVLHALNARSPRAVLFSRRLFGNPWLWGALILSLGLVVAALELPSLAAVLDVARLPTEALLLAAGAATVPLLLGQLVRLARGRATGA